jgi:hypothetical protein
MTKRRMPAPWSVIEKDEAFIVQDANGFPLAYVYFASGARIAAANRMTRDEAGAVALNIAKLPQLISESKERKP